LKASDMPASWNDDWPNPVRLEAFVTQNRARLDGVHAAIQRPCVIPFRYAPDYLDQGHQGEFSAIYYSLLCEGKWATLQGRTADAKRAYLDCIRLGIRSARGGTHTQWLKREAYVYAATAALCELESSFVASECSEIIESLQSIEAEREPLQLFAARDRAWEDRGVDWEQRLINRLKGWAWPEDREFASIMASAYRSVPTQLRLLAVRLALRRYRLSEGHPAQALRDLAPRYLAELPPDPYTGREFIYRPPGGPSMDDQYMLYSAGRDGKDDGGKHPLDHLLPWAGG
jgi:hypothetical protein